MEIINQLALVAVKLGNKKKFLKYFKEGTRRAKVLRSQKRLRSCKELGGRVEHRPHEQEVLELDKVLY